MTYTQAKAAGLLEIASATAEIGVAQGCANEFLRRKDKRLARVADYVAENRSADAIAAQTRLADRNQTNYETAMTFVAALTPAPAKARKARKASTAKVVLTAEETVAKDALVAKIAEMQKFLDSIS